MPRRRISNRIAFPIIAVVTILLLGVIFYTQNSIEEISVESAKVKRVGESIKNEDNKFNESEIYTSPIFHYSIQYPKEWSIKRYESSHYLENIEFSPNGHFPSGVDFDIKRDYLISIYIFDNPSGLSARDWYAKEYNRVTGEYTDISINGIQGIEDNYSAMPYSLIILLSNKKKDSKIYWINYWEWGKHERHLEIFYQMINTFQISK